MAHPVHEFRLQQAELQAQIAELQARLDAIAPAPTPAKPVDHRGRPLPPGTYEDQMGCLRALDGREYVEHVPTMDEMHARAISEGKRLEAEQVALWAKRTAGLKAGYWRDDCGTIRAADGRVAAGVEYEQQQIDRVERIRGQEHRRYKQENHLPVRDDDEDDFTSTLN